MSDTVAQIRTALAKLPVLEDKKDKLDGFAQSIAACARVRRGGHLAASRRGSAPALKDLKGLQSKVIRLAAALDALRPDAHIALRSQTGVQLVDMMRVLEDWGRHISDAHRKLSEAPSVETQTGAPPKTVELAVAVYCARKYEVLVGRPAGISVGLATHNEARGPLNEAGGAFLSFLSEVFGALGLEGSVEHYAKEAIALVREVKK